MVTKYVVLLVLGAKKVIFDMVTLPFSRFVKDSIPKLWKTQFGIKLSVLFYLREEELVDENYIIKVLH